jgi:hypothetical protein
MKKEGTSRLWSLHRHKTLPETPTPKKHLCTCRDRQHQVEVPVPQPQRARCGVQSGSTRSLESNSLVFRIAWIAQPIVLLFLKWRHNDFPHPNFGPDRSSGFLSILLNERWAFLFHAWMILQGVRKQASKQARININQSIGTCPAGLWFSLFLADVDGARPHP